MDTHFPSEFIWFGCVHELSLAKLLPPTLGDYQVNVG